MSYSGMTNTIVWLTCGGWRNQYAVNLALNWLVKYTAQSAGEELLKYD